MSKEKILAGRKAVGAYREAHHLISKGVYYKNLSDDHKPLLETLLTGLKEQGFDSIQEFFTANEEFNLRELNPRYEVVGECNKCGKCCEGCEQYEGNGICAEYDERPQKCKDYPMLISFYRGKLPDECSCFLVLKEGQTKGEIDLGWQ